MTVIKWVYDGAGCYIYIYTNENGDESKLGDYNMRKDLKVFGIYIGGRIYISYTLDYS